MLRLVPRLLVLLFAFPLAVAAQSPDAGEAARPEVQVFKSPTCGCCTKWEKHLEARGFRIQSTHVDDLTRIKRWYGVPADAAACHTAIVEGYVIEGHVPVADVERLLRERPEVRGLIVPGMPLGSPGMESPTPEPYSVYTFDGSGLGSVYSRHE
jgi:hypothetical protein